MTDDLKERLLSWQPGQDEESLHEEAADRITDLEDRITDLEARLAAAEADRDYWQKDSAAAWDKCEERRLQAVAAEAGEDALAMAGRKLVGHPGWGTVHYTDNGMWRDGADLRAALAAYEARRKGEMATDPKDAEIARLTAALAESEAAAEGALMILVQTQAERDAALAQVAELRGES